MDATPADPLASDPVAGEGSPRAHRLAEPKRPYTVTLTVHGAPGPFKDFGATAQYDVSNRKCGKYNSDTGTRMRITANESFPIEKISDTEYRGRFYLDLMRDEDFFGNGICHWEFTAIRIGLRATGASGETTFMPFAMKDSVSPGFSQTRYFWSGYYPGSRKPIQFSDSGDTSLDAVPADKKDEFFTIRMDIKEEYP